MLGLILTFGTVYATENSENIETGAYNGPEKEIYFINEDGTIVKETSIETSVTTENDGNNKTETNKKARAVNGLTSSSTAVVNFRTKRDAGQNTNYKEVSTNRDGYVNGHYAADAAFLGFDNDSNPTKVKFLQAVLLAGLRMEQVQEQKDYRRD